MVRFFFIFLILLAGYMYYQYGGEDPKHDPAFKPVGAKVDLSGYNKTKNK